MKTLFRGKESGSGLISETAALVASLCSKVFLYLCILFSQPTGLAVKIMPFSKTTKFTKNENFFLG